MAGTATSGRAPALVEAERNYREELTAMRAESIAFAEAVRGVGEFLATPRPANAVVNLGGLLVHQAMRRLRQLRVALP